MILHICIFYLLLPRLSSLPTMGVMDYISSFFKFRNPLHQIQTPAHYTSIKPHELPLISMYKETIAHINLVKGYIKDHFDELCYKWYKVSQVQSPNFESWFTLYYEKNANDNPHLNRLTEMYKYVAYHPDKMSDTYISILNSEERSLKQSIDKIKLKVEEMQSEMHVILNQLREIDIELVEIAERTPLESNLPFYIGKLKSILALVKLKMQSFQIPTTNEADDNISKYTQFLYSNDKHKKGLKVVKEFNVVKKTALLSWIKERDSMIYKIASKPNTELHMIQEYIRIIRNAEDSFFEPNAPNALDNIQEYSKLLLAHGLDGHEIVNRFGELSDCSICLLKMGSKKIGLPLCKHEYHNHCITRWYEYEIRSEQLNGRCPMCRIQFDRNSNHKFVDPSRSFLSRENSLLLQELAQLDE